METIVHHSLILLFGVFGFSTYGLLASCIISILVGILLLLRRSKFALSDLQETFSTSSLNLIYKHSNAIKYYAPANFIKNISENLHIILLSKFFPLEVVGIFAFAQKIMQVPAAIMSSLTQVLLKEFADSASLTIIKQMYHELYLKLWSFAILFITGTLILPNEVMDFMFGEKWANAGTFTKLIAIWFASQLVATILAVIYIKLEKQYYLLIFNIINTILVIAAFILLTLYNFDIYEVITLISCFKLLLNIIQTTLPYLLLRRHPNHG
jgi:O-antigen/teichoic acid export membrane protein